VPYLLRKGFARRRRRFGGYAAPAQRLAGERRNRVDFPVFTLSGGPSGAAAFGKSE
jgi:hypothetical protein